MTDSLSIPTMHRDHLLKALNDSKTTVRAAQRLGIHDRTLRRWKAAFGIRRNPETRKWEIVAVLVVLLFSSCYSGDQLQKRFVWHRMRAGKGSVHVRYECPPKP